MDDFDAFWAAYPPRAGPNPKQAARKQWKRAIRTTPPHEIIQATQAFREECLQNDSFNSVYVPHARTWLSQQRYEDYETDQSSGDSVVGDNRIGAVDRNKDDAGGVASAVMPPEAESSLWPPIRARLRSEMGMPTWKTWWQDRVVFDGMWQNDTEDADGVWQSETIANFWAIDTATEARLRASGTVDRLKELWRAEDVTVHFGVWEAEPSNVVQLRVG